MKNKKLSLKKITNDIIKIICLITMICVSFKISSYVLRTHNHKILNNGRASVELIHKNKDVSRDSDIEILSIGNSDLYSGFNPLQLWHEKGITSYVAAAPRQNMKMSYCLLKQILTIQRPKLLILEVDNFFETRSLDYNQDEEELSIQYCLPLVENSERWSYLKEKSYYKKRNNNPRYLAQGYFYQDKVVPYISGNYMKKNDKKAKVSQYTQNYLPKVIELAKLKNCDILFLCVPSATSWNNTKHNIVSELSKQYQIPFLDLNCETLTEFNWKTCSRDGGNHLNDTGAKSVTKYLGNYLQNNYQFYEKRNHIDFQTWDEKYRIFSNRYYNENK